VESYQFFVGSLGEDYEPFGMAGHQQDREGDAREEAGQGQGQREGEDDLNDTHSRDALIDEVHTYVFSLVHRKGMGTGVVEHIFNLIYTEWTGWISTGVRLGFMHVENLQLLHVYVPPTVRV